MEIPVGEGNRTASRKLELHLLKQAIPGLKFISITADIYIEDRTLVINTAVFRRLDAPTVGRAMRMPVLVRAQMDYLSSGAPSISNRVYWENLVDKFEPAKLGDDSLNGDLGKFMDRVGPPEKSVIEFGCGIGRSYPVLRRRGVISYLGTDISDKAVSMARDRLPGVRFMQGDMIDFSCPERFDSAIATDVLLYLSPEDQIASLMNIRNLLNPGAPLLIRWAPGNNEIKLKIIKDTTIQGWVFLATKQYIEALLKVTGYLLFQAIELEPEIINRDRPDQRIENYYKVFAQKTTLPM